MVADSSILQRDVNVGTIISFTFHLSSFYLSSLCVTNSCNDDCIGLNLYKGLSILVKALLS